MDLTGYQPLQVILLPAQDDTLKEGHPPVPPIHHKDGVKRDALKNLNNSPG